MSIKVLCLAVLYATAASAQQNMDTIVHAQAARLVQGQPWAALSVAVLENGKVDRYDFGAAGPGTVFEIGSITKTFTTLLLAHAVLEKKVKLTDDIRRYLDGDYPNLVYKGTPIQLIHLASLRSALPDNMPRGDREDFLRDLHEVVLDTLPGANPRHSNAAALLLGFILENVYHMSYTALVEKYITGPLGMQDTYITLPEDKEGRLAKGYDGKGGPKPYIGAGAGSAGGMKSSMGDMAIYMKYQLAEGDEAVKMTHQPAWGDIRSFALGLNWFLGTNFDGQRKVSNDGTTFAFTCCCQLFPERHFGVMIMINENASNSSIQDKLYGMASAIYNEHFFSAAERASDGFGYSRSINLLLAELHKRGFDHAIDAEAALAKSHPGFVLDENEVNNWAYALMGKGKLQAALEVFRLNTSLHPRSWNAYDSEAEAFEGLGDKANAIKYYQQSLALNPRNGNAAVHLKKLQGN